MLEAPINAFRAQEEGKFLANLESRTYNIGITAKGSPASNSCSIFAPPARRDMKLGIHSLDYSHEPSYSITKLKIRTRLIKTVLAS